MKRFMLAVCVLALTGCLAAGSFILFYRANEKKGVESSEEIRMEMKKEPEADVLEITPDTTEEPEGTTAPTATSEFPDIPVDFGALQEENPDVYAWITVPGTQIDYPVLQHSADDSFYIHHGPDGEYLFAGAVYSELQNKKDFSDSHTVLYGHNMKNGTMFAGLHKFRDREFFDKNRSILVYTPEHIYHYEIFAAYPFDDRHLLNSFDWRSSEGFRQYLEEVYSVRAMDAYFIEKKATKKDNILTLSTCIGNAEHSRYLVQGVLRETE